MTLFIYRSPKRLALIGLVAFCLTTVMMFIIYNDNKSSNLFISEPLKLHSDQEDGGIVWPARKKFINLAAPDYNGTEKTYNYSREMPMVFIGGMPRSGTTLLRVMLDSHPDIRCGGETRVIPRLLNLRNTWLKAPFESERLLEAGITAKVLDNAIGEFILEIIARHGRPAKRLCNKDPFTIKSALYIRSLFPRAQFLYLIRDGRAVAHSIVSRKVTISGFNITDYRQCLKKWNSVTMSMFEQCNQLGPKVCLPVYYEQLVLHPEQTLRGILKFLQLPWNESVLHHEKFVNKPDKDGGIELSKLERSTDQVVKPVNTKTLSTWVGAIPADVVRDMAKIATMLEVLGYDPNANPPNYGDPDAFVMAKMKSIDDNKEMWQKKEEELIKQREDMRKRLTAQGKQQQQLDANNNVDTSSSSTTISNKKEQQTTKG